MLTEEGSALNVMYQLSINDDAKAMITFTDTIQTVSSLSPVILELMILRQDVRITFSAEFS